MKNTYETTACRSYDLKAVRSSLAVALTNGELVQATTAAGRPLKNIYIVTPYSKDISSFHHPIQAMDARNKVFIAIDQRPNVALTPQGESKIRQPSDYHFLTLRASLEALWCDDFAQDLLGLGAIPMRAFARWLSEGITRRLGLPVQDQLIAQIVTAFYYICLFQVDGDEATPFTEDDYMRIVTRIRNYMGIPVEDSLRVLTGMPMIRNLKEYSTALQEAIPNARLNAVNPAFIIAACSGGWYGPNNRETMSVAMEYPPAFLAIVYTAITDRSMNSAMMSKFVATVARGKDSEQFTKSLKAYLENLDDV